MRLELEKRGVEGPWSWQMGVERFFILEGEGHKGLFGHHCLLLCNFVLLIFLWCDLELRELKKNIFGWTLNEREGHFGHCIANRGLVSWEGVGKGIKVRDLLALKTTGTHVGFRLTDKNATFKWCPSSRFSQSSCLNILDQMAKFWDVVQRISSH